jgi:hypothetical protein
LIQSILAIKGWWSNGSERSNVELLNTVFKPAGSKQITPLIALINAPVITLINGPLISLLIQPVFKALWPAITCTDLATHDLAESRCCPSRQVPDGPICLSWPLASIPPIPVHVSPIEEIGRPLLWFGVTSGRCASSLLPRPTLLPGQQHAAAAPSG